MGCVAEAGIRMTRTRQDNLDLHIVLVKHLLKAKKKFKNLKKQEIQDIFIKVN